MCRSANHSMLELVILAAQLATATAASWSGANLMSPSRSLLADDEKPVGLILSEVSLAATPLSEFLKELGLEGEISNNPDFSVAHPEALVAPRRPLKVAFYDRLDDSRTAEEQDYIMNKLMPAAANVLAGSMRIRNPSGVLPFVGFKNRDGSMVSPPPADKNGKVPDGVDADVLMEVTSLPSDAEACEGVIAGAIPAIFEDVTYRPVFGIVRLCQVGSDQFESDMATVVHEIMHALGFGSFAFPVYPGYPNGQDDFTVMDDDGGYIITAPNVQRAVRNHFGCSTLEGAEFEDDGVSGTVNSHWEERIFQGELLDSGDSGNTNHFNRHIMSDLTLAFMQDTNWYDVKYGSAGFNSYGYNGGCAFATGSKREAMDDPNARRYLCSEKDDWVFMCTHDFTGDGVCISDPLLEGFKQVLQFDVGAVDCATGDTAPGTRCLQGKDEFFPECVKMTCSEDKKVLVNGKPCDQDKMLCPQDELMCGDPGLLTCAETLNDCSGKGDCYMGSCFCHTGWGGEDCSVPVCYDKCDDGSDCPASGFCGVDECGEWSAGSSSTGLSCKATEGEIDAHTNATTHATDAPPSPSSAHRMPPEGMMRDTHGQEIFGPEDVPADIPEVKLTDAVRSTGPTLEQPSSDYEEDYAGDYVEDEQTDYGEPDYDAPADQEPENDAPADDGPDYDDATADEPGDYTEADEPGEPGDYTEADEPGDYMADESDEGEFTPGMGQGGDAPVPEASGMYGQYGGYGGLCGGYGDDC